MTTTSWGRSLADAEAAVQLRRPGDDASPCYDSRPTPTPCDTCDGTGTVSIAVPLSNALLLSDRPCPDCRGDVRLTDDGDRGSVEDRTQTNVAHRGERT